MFMTGVIEGFYGRAWTMQQRVEMLDWIADAGMNTFVYAHKDDIKLRARWRELYNDAEFGIIASLVDQARARGLSFMVAIAPGLDMIYSRADEIETLNRRIDQLASIGVGKIALLFDDVPNHLPERDAHRFSSFADAQCFVANSMLAHMRSIDPDMALYFCPTEYCAAFAGGDVVGSSYLNTIGAGLDPDIMVMWTGPDIVSETIPAASLIELAGVIKRKPVIWDNFHANDYDVRRIYAGPLGGRSSDILPLISGYITNPNNEFEANFVAVQTTGALLNQAHYEEGPAFEAALARWHRRFRLAHGSGLPNHLRFDELRLLAELFYQPFTLGPHVEAALTEFRAMLEQHRPDTQSQAWRDGLQHAHELKSRIESLYERMTELENRDLFYTFQPYLWEAREEMVHLCSYLDWLDRNPAADEEFPSRSKIYNFYRRGFGVAVQELFPRDREGHYRHGR